MNINFNKIKREFNLFLFSLIFFPLSVFSSMDFHKEILKNQEMIIPINLKKNSYIKGSYKISEIVQSIDLLDKNKKFIRTLFKLDKLQSVFFFLTYDKSKFYLKIRNKNKTNKVNINIEKILPVNYKKQNTKGKILSSFIKEQEKKLSLDKDTKTFWENVKKVGTPLVEHIKKDEYLITFLYRGAKHNVRLLGGPVSNHVYLSRLKNSDIWYKSFKVKKGLLTSYQLAPDVPNIKGSFWEKRVAILSTAQVDPFNKTPFISNKQVQSDKYSKISTFKIVEKNSKDWTLDEGNPKGKIVDTKIKSLILGDTRNISIYKPFNYDYKKPHQLLFVFDGVSYQQRIPTPLILDNLIAKKKILPTVAVFIDNPSSKARANQLPCNENFADFMAKELLPFVHKKIKIKQSAKNTILTGSSYGGLASMYVAFTYPKLFGKVLSQSGSFWWSPKDSKQSQWLTKKIQKEPKKDLDIYLNAGLYETGHLPMDILESNRNLKNVLISKGYKNIILEEYQNSHDFFAWRAHLAKGLIELSKTN